jgi:hypothetical protein
MPSYASTAANAREYGLSGSPLASALYRENFPRDQINTDNAIGATTLATAMAVWVNAGDVITKASVCVGATAGATLTHKFFALYSNATIPALIGTQQTDDTGAAMAANTVYTGTFGATYTVTTSGLIWVALVVTGTTPPTLVGKTSNVNATVAAALNTLTGLTNGVCITATGSAGATAPTTLASITQLAVMPWVLLQ